MYIVEVKNVCRCFLKEGMAEHQEFSLKSEAAEEAERMFAFMQKNFCKKHEFVLNERFGTFTISIVDRKR